VCTVGVFGWDSGQFSNHDHECRATAALTRPFPHPFSPLKLDSKPLEHRLNFGAHTANMSVDGNPVDRHLAFYRKRAIGGAAMIVVEPVPVRRSSALTRGEFRCEDDSIIPYFRRITMPCMSMARSSSKRSAVAPRRAMRRRRSLRGGGSDWPCENRAVAAPGRLCRITVRGRK